MSRESKVCVYLRKMAVRSKISHDLNEWWNRLQGPDGFASTLNVVFFGPTFRYLLFKLTSKEGMVYNNSVSF